MTDFERTPPHDVAAERCVLGGMLLSKDAISDVLEVIRPADHYRPAHQLVHEAILGLYSRGEPADAITVANDLTRRGEITRVGGAPYLHTLIASVPTAANAGYYARIVRERAILRRLVEAGTRIVQFGYAGEADADELVDRAQAEVYAIADPSARAAVASLAEYDLGALADKGIPTPALLCGDLLYEGGLHSLAGPPDSGKSLLVYWWALQLRRAGRHVMILDEEAGPEQVVEKMTALGATTADLRPPGLTYVPFPARTWTASDLAALRQCITDRRPVLTCWDSSAAFMATGGLDENSAADVTRFWSQVLTPVAREYGSAVVVIDHDTKDGPASRYARGSGAKLAATDVAYKVDPVKPFSRVSNGILDLTVTKDRRGWLHRHHRIAVTVRPVLTLDICESEAEAGTSEMPPARAKLLAALDEVPASIADLVGRVVDAHGHGLKRETASRELTALLESGLADRTDQGRGKPALWMRNPSSGP